MVKLRIEKFFIIKEKCICLNTSKEEDNFICHKPEVDVRFFFHANYLCNSQASHDIPRFVIDAENTDLVCMAANLAHIVNNASDHLDRRRKNHDCKYLSLHFMSLLVLTVLVDFVVIPKRLFFRKNVKSPEPFVAFRNLGKEYEVVQCVSEELESFTIKIICNDSKRKPRQSVEQLNGKT